ncbi:MAG: hypothetical protein KDA93_16300 [Planctomycetaceae bacterium]|nr:hypothetical protein [Planctomycetaceae bacterium]
MQATAVDALCTFPHPAGWPPAGNLSGLPDTIVSFPKLLTAVSLHRRYAPLVDDTGDRGVVPL